MNGPEHYAQAEKLLAGSAHRAKSQPLTQSQAGIAALESAQAQVHATLALVSSTYESGQEWPTTTRVEWIQVLGLNQ